MYHYFAPMEGITGYVFRNAHSACFGGVDKYFSPFLSPNAHHKFSHREFEDIRPDHNQGLTLAVSYTHLDVYKRQAFSTRILATLGGVSPQKAASFLLGVVLRADLDALNAFEAAQKGAGLYIAGKEPLQQALCDLLTAFGHAARPVPAEITGRIGVVGALKIAGYL